MKNSGKRESNVVDIGSVTTGKLNAEVDELFKLPLAEFTGARNSLAARLKQNGRANDANLVKTLTKPSVSAWAVNQLYWNHRKAFDELHAAGQRIRKAQTSGVAGKGMRESLDARREVLVHLSDLAASLLTEAGHSPGPDTLRRITTTLEALSALGSLEDGPTPGRLTQDVDPPGFESLASFMAGAYTTKAEPARAASKTVGPRAGKATRETVEDTRQARQVEEMRQARIVAAKLSLQAAKKSFADARANAQSLDVAQRKAHAEAKQAEKQVREAEERLKKANVVSEAAAERADAVAAEAEEAAKAAEDAKRAVEKATKELETLFGEN
ncbi:MAG: hypothetical protein LC794_04995 [Acidobacteria bacterium]|nr:hypothetical protein [Acidobacteriota bacterium]